MSFLNWFNRHGAFFVALLFVGVPAVFAGDTTTIRLTDDGRLKRDPVFTDASGESLVYVVQENPIQLRLMKLNLKSDTEEPIHKDETRSEFEPAYSADGRVLSFVQNIGNLRWQLAIVDFKTGKRAFANVGPGGFSGLRSPAVFPDASRVWFSQANGGRQHLYSIDLDGKNVKQMTDFEGVTNWPSFTADGKRVVFSSSREGNYDIYVMNVDGTGLKKLTENPRQDIRPCLSPDGSQIAFTSSRDGNYEVYVIGTDGNEVTRITESSERDDYPAWHPDGKRLVTVSERKGRFDLYLLTVPE